MAMAMSTPLFLGHAYDEGREEVLQYLITGHISSQVAADRLASISVSDPSDYETGLGRTWRALFIAARVIPEGQEKLIDLLTCISKSSPPEKEEAEHPTLAGRAWSDMLYIGWTARYEYDGAEPSCKSPSCYSVLNLSV